MRFIIAEIKKVCYNVLLREGAFCLLRVFARRFRRYDFCARIYALRFMNVDLRAPRFIRLRREYAR